VIWVSPLTRRAARVIAAPGVRAFGLRREGSSCRSRTRVTGTRAGPASCSMSSA